MLYQNESLRRCNRPVSSTGLLFLLWLFLTSFFISVFMHRVIFNVLVHFIFGEQTMLWKKQKAVNILFYHRLKKQL
jgi:hypothetical protein